MYVKEILICYPNYNDVRYEDNSHKICKIIFDNKTEWTPTLPELNELNEKFNRCHKYNLENDKKGRKFNKKPIEIKINQRDLKNQKVII